MIILAKKQSVTRDIEGREHIVESASPLYKVFGDIGYFIYNIILLTGIKWVVTVVVTKAIPERVK